MSVTDREMFESAISDEPQADTTPAEPAPQEQAAPETSEPARDPETGRFAPKQAETDQEQPETPTQAPVAPVEPVQTKEQEHRVPLRELLDERERRQDLQRRVAEYEARIRHSEKPPQPPPDPFENPNGFLEHGVREAISPVQSELGKMREYYSEQLAQQKFGQETVKQAYEAMGESLSQRDPDAWAVYQRAMNSMDPYGVIVSWHKKTAVLKQIGEDPNAWFERQLEERIKDPTHQAQLIERIRGNVAPNGVDRSAPNVKLPPSLNRLPSAAPRTDDDGDMSDQSLFRHALR